MRNVVLLGLSLVLLGVAPVFAISVSEAVVTTGLSDRAPVDSVQTYPAGVEKLYCFTYVVGIEQETVVTHVWFRGNTEMARVELPVYPPDFRTWSVKSLRPEWTGKWRVEVIESGGRRLSTVPFTLN